MISGLGQPSDVWRSAACQWLTFTAHPAFNSIRYKGRFVHVLVTGGAGYIGSHTAVQLLTSGIDVTVLDNFSNSSPAVLQQVQALGQRRLHLVHGDVRDAGTLDAIFAAPTPIDAVMHFAGLKAAGESVGIPLAYYDNNVTGTLQLLKAMQRAHVHTLIFSSTAAIYGNPAPEQLPLAETTPCSPTGSPYAASKWMAEHCLADLHGTHPHWRIARLRYFNAVGAHPSGRMGEHPQGVPNNLMPFINQVACGSSPTLPIFGDDYPTPDGTGVRDYVHVMDLADGHVATLHYLMRQNVGELLTLNLGSGQGHSVLELVRAFEAASGRTIARHAAPRRQGDVPTNYANTSLAQQLLGWHARRGLAEMCLDAWRWQISEQRAAIA